MKWLAIALVVGPLIGVILRRWAHEFDNETMTMAAWQELRQPQRLRNGSER